MCRLLRERGLDHIVFDNFEQGHRESIPGSSYVQGDLRNAADLNSTFDAYPQIDLVMHFAAYISVGASVREPEVYYRNNTTGVLGLLEVMKGRGLDKIVFSSTAAVYGEPHYTPIDEGHPKAPTSPYGHSKLAAEWLLDDLGVAHGLKSVVLRYFNASGAHPSGEIGEDHSPEEHLIPLAIQAATGQRGALKVFGTDWDTPDGTCVRDYIHVWDLAHAHLAAIEHLRAGGESCRYNVGVGAGFSVREVLDTVSRVGGTLVPSEEADRRPGDPARLIASSEAIQKAWGWSPQRSDLETIVADAWNWHRSHPKGYRS
ncbi:MAG: UDP-glucose 4-epimerase GalE [Fimbriimonas sp.]